MPMPTAATATDVEDALVRSLTDDEAARVDRLIERAEAIVAGDMPGFTFGTGSEEAELEGDGDDYLVLPRYPVTAVTSVTIAGLALTDDDYRFDVLGRLRRRGSAIANPHDDALDGLRLRWPDAGTIIVVGYDYGFAASTVPGDITAVVAELVAAKLTNPEQIVQEAIGDRSHTYARTLGAGDELTAGQRHRLRHWRRNRFAAGRVRS
jgi:hypothetical protein